MVKKLFKYELAYYFRTVWPVYIVLLGIAVTSRVIQFFEFDSPFYYLVFFPTVFAFYFAALAAAFLITALAVVRFYKNLFTAEGYLTFTLPVKPAQHLFVKLVSALIVELTVAASVIVSILIMISGELSVELVKAIIYIVSHDPLNALNIALIIAEYSVLITVCAISGLLVYYTCICIGQLARKNRILVAVLTYFGYTAIMQVISYVISIVFIFGSSIAMIGLSMSGTLESLIGETLATNPMLVYHVVTPPLLVLYAALAVVLFIVDAVIIKKKLNIE